MIPKELLKQVKNIEIKTSRLVNTTFSGQYQSAFKGHGIEFAEVREYSPGDDIRSIDWNVTARTGSPFIKLFHEERELSVFFLVDVSASMQFGSGARMKSEIAAEICALLALAAVNNNDKVGLMLVSGKIEKYVPLGKGKQHVLRVAREILCFTPSHTETNLGVGVEMIAKVLKRKSVIFVISDFYNVPYQKPLRIIAQKHDVTAIRLYDIREEVMPRMGNVVFCDPETGEKWCGNTNKRVVRDHLARENATMYEAFNRSCRSINVSTMHINCAQPYINEIRRYLDTREVR